MVLDAELWTLIFIIKRGQERITKCIYRYKIFGENIIASYKERRCLTHYSDYSIMVAIVMGVVAPLLEPLGTQSFLLRHDT